MLKRAQAPESAQKITFVLPSDHPAGKVSLVGNFDNWTPGTHELKKRSNGTMSTAVTVPSGSTRHFRFLGEDGSWFDEAEADYLTAQGSFVRA